MCIYFFQNKFIISSQPLIYHNSPSTYTFPFWISSSLYWLSCYTQTYLFQILQASQEKVLTGEDLYIQKTFIYSQQEMLIQQGFSHTSERVYSLYNSKILTTTNIPL